MDGVASGKDKPFTHDSAPRPAQVGIYDQVTSWRSPFSSTVLSGEEAQKARPTDQ